MSERPDMEGPWSGRDEWSSYSLAGARTGRWDHLVPPKDQTKDQPKDQTMDRFPTREELQRAMWLLELCTSEITVTRVYDIDNHLDAPLDCHFVTCHTLKDCDRPCRMYEDFLVPIIERWVSELGFMSRMAVQPMPEGPQVGFQCVNFKDSRIPLRFTMAYDAAQEGVVLMTDFMCRQLGTHYPQSS